MSAVSEAFARAEDAKRAYEHAQAQAEAAQAAEKEAARVKLLTSAASAKQSLAEAIDSDQDAVIPFVSTSGKARVVTARDQEDDARTTAGREEYRRVLNSKGVAFDVLRQSGMNGLAALWGVKRCKAFDNLTFNTVYHSLQSLEGRNKGGMKQRSADALRPIYNLLRRRKA